MNRIVALKVIRKELLADREVVGRFQREIQVVSQLTHPNIVHAYDAGPAGGTFFLVMEYVEGIDLTQFVKQHGPLSVERASEYLRQAALGLQHIHERGLVHRDMKPSNLLITQAPGSSSVIKLLDLGLARLQRPVDELTTDVGGANATMGTLDYMAPEQALDFHRVDIRADIYSLGCTFYFALTGKAPFEGGTVAQKLMRHQQTVPPSLDQLRREVPASLAAVLRRMMAKRPEDRYATPLELIQELPFTAPLATLVGSGTTPIVTGALVPVAPPRALVVAEERPTDADVFTRSLLLIPRRLARLPQARRPRRWRVIIAGLGLFVLATGLFGWLLLRPAAGPLATGSIAASPTLPLEGKVTFLSDLPEIKFQVHWNAKLGKNGDLGRENKRIMLNGVYSPKGIGMYPRDFESSFVSYRLDKQFKLFKGTATLNDSVNSSASPLIFSVLGDGRTLWQSKAIQKRGDHQPCSIGIADVSVLELVVSCPNESSNGHAAWIEPQLLR